METRAYRPDIDGLRCFAVSVVVLSHAGLPWFAGGYVGVDVFFVISGYLITRILWAGLDDYPRSIATFYERRARRILPALMVAVTATLAAGAFVLGPDQFAELGNSAIATTLFVSNLWFWDASRDYFAPSVRLAPLLHTWSLAVEEQFYIVFPLLMALTARITPPAGAAAHRRHLRDLPRALGACDRDRANAIGLLPAAEPRLGARHRRRARADRHSHPALAARGGSDRAPRRGRDPRPGPALRRRDPVSRARGPAAGARDRGSDLAQP